MQSNQPVLDVHASAHFEGAAHEYPYPPGTDLCEQLRIWKEAADIQTADMLKLPTPEAEYITVTTEPSSFQQEMVAELGERAEAVRNREVEPDEDNMLKITSDGRKLALDQRRTLANSSAFCASVLAS